MKYKKKRMLICKNFFKYGKNVTRLRDTKLRKYYENVGKVDNILKYQKILEKYEKMLRDAKKMFGNWRNVKRIKGFIVRNVQR
jgi:hypothetical protein